MYVLTYFDTTRRAKVWEPGTKCLRGPGTITNSQADPKPPGVHSAACVLRRQQASSTAGIIYAPVRRETPPGNAEEFSPSRTAEETAGRWHFHKETKGLP